MSAEIVEFLYSRDSSRRAKIIRRPDGTFGYVEEYHFNNEEAGIEGWTSLGGNVAVYDTLETALREIPFNVAWPVAATHPDGAEHHEDETVPLTDSSLSELEGKSTERLLTAEVFDHEAFIALLAYLRQRAKDLRTEPAVPKQVLVAILKASGAIRSRAEYLAGVRPHAALADELDTLLGVIARGEDPDGRRPGVPRII